MSLRLASLGDSKLLSQQRKARLAPKIIFHLLKHRSRLATGRLPHRVLHLEVEGAGEIESPLNCCTKKEGPVLQL